MRYPVNPEEQAAFTIKQLASRWSTSHNTVGRMIRAGRLKAFTVGIAGSRKPRYRIPYSEVIRHENGDASGGMNERQAAALKKPMRRRGDRYLPPVKEFFK